MVTYTLELEIDNQNSCDHKKSHNFKAKENNLLFAYSYLCSVETTEYYTLNCLA